MQRLAERRDELMELAAARSRAGLRARLDAMRSGAWPIAQTALAAALAWLAATELTGHSRPFFAPVAACICIGVSAGQHARRTVEVCLGVAVGILVGDLLVIEIGTGTVQVAAVIALAMVAAVLLGGSQLLIGQAATSAALVATIQPPTDGIALDRFFDALIGGGIGIGIALLLPVDPLHRVRRAITPVFAALAAALRDVGLALRERDDEAADAALERAREIDDTVTRARDVLETTRDVVRFAPGRRRTRQSVERWRHALGQLDMAVRNTRVLARGARRAIDLEDNVPPGAFDALEALASAVEALERTLRAKGDEREAAYEEAVVQARRAAGAAGQVMEQTGNLSASVIVGQIRSTAVDLLRGLGMGRDTATHAVREAARRPAQPPR